MKNTAIIVQKSIVMLFSFVMVAATLTLINIADNATGNPLSSVSSAFADSGSITVGGTFSSPTSAFTNTNSGCGTGLLSSCGSTQVGGTPSSGGGGGGASVEPDPNAKSIFYPCSSVDGSGNCNVNGVTTSDRRIYSTSRTCTLEIDGVGTVANTGDGAVSYLENYVIGQADSGFGMFVPTSDPEQLFIALTGYQPGTGLPFFLPGDWFNDNIYNYNYNGTTTDMAYGAYRWHCWDMLSSVGGTPLQNVTCGPVNDGRPFPYSIGYYVDYTNLNTGTVVYVDYGGNTLSAQNNDWNIAGASCVYVSPSTPPPSYLGKTDTCYWVNGYSGYYSTNRSAILSGGASTTTPPTPLTPLNSAPYLTGSNTTAQVNNCINPLNMNASLSLADGYAYYRLTADVSSQSFQYYYWDPAWTGGQTLLANIVPTGITQYTKSSYGTFTCQNKPSPYRQYDDWASLPNLSFSYAECGNGSSWQCADPNSPLINNVSNPVDLMRDGGYIPTNLGGVNVSGNGIRDMGGQVGTVSDNNMSFMVNVVNGSSPFYGSNANDPKQYFKLWNSSKSSTIPWGTWVTSPNANRNSFLNFFWSSDNGSNWKMTYQAKIDTAQFAVPWQDTSVSPPTTKWMTDTNVQCGSGTSNPATILRSVTTTGQ